MDGIRLLTRADDAGLNVTTNKAIRASVRQGIVRNVSFMAPAPEITHAADTLGDLAKQVDFGLHLCLNAEWTNLRWGPVSSPDDVGSLLRDDGSFPSTPTELADQSPVIEEMIKEAEAQLDFLAKLGIAVSYLDEHMAVGSTFDLHEPLENFAKKNGLVYDRTLAGAGRISNLPGWDGPGEHPGTELADHLATVPAGTYRLVGHPAFKTGEMGELRLPGKPAGSQFFLRNRQRRMFADIEIVDYCENVGVDLLRYSQFA